MPHGGLHDPIFGPLDRLKLLGRLLGGGVTGAAEGALTVGAGLAEIFGRNPTDLSQPSPLAGRLRDARSALSGRAEEAIGGPGFGTGRFLGRAASEAAATALPATAGARALGVGGRTLGFLQGSQGATRAVRGAQAAAFGAPGAAAVELGETPEGSLLGSLGSLVDSERLQRAAENPALRAAGGAALTAPFDLAFGAAARTGAREAPDKLVQKVKEVEAEKAARDAAEVARGPLRVKDVEPKFEAQDYDVLLSTLQNDPLQREAVAARASRLKESGAIPKKGTLSYSEALERGLEDPESVIGKDWLLKGADAQSLAAREIFKENEQRIVEGNRILANLAEGSDEHAKVFAALEALEETNDVLMAKHVEASSAGGRFLNSLKDQANQSLDPLTWFGKAERMLAGAPLTDEMKTTIRGYLEAGDSQGLVEFIASLRTPLTWRDLEFWTTLRKSGLISAPISVGRAALGNTARGLFDTAARPAMVVADILASQKTGVRTTTGTGLRTTAAQARGFVEGIGEGVEVLKGRNLAQVSEKLEIPKTQRLESGLRIGREGIRFRKPSTIRFKDELAGVDPVDAWTQVWFRSQGALDKPASRAAYNRSIAEQAINVARFVEGLDGPAFTKELRRRGLTAEQARELAESTWRQRARFLQENPTPEMVTRATFQRNVAAFQQETALGNVAQGIRAGARAGVPIGTKRIPTKGAAAVADIVQPFNITPSAIVSTGFEATPLGFFGAGQSAVLLRNAMQESNIDVALVEELQKRFARQAGRATTGSALAFLVGSRMYEDGNLTLGVPQEATQRDQFFGEGKKPYAIRAGGRWWSLAQVQPFGSAIAFGGAMADEAAQQAAEGEGGVPSLVGESLGRSAVQGGAMALETPFATGARQVVEGLRDPVGAGGRNLKSVAGSFVPNLVAKTAQALDPEVKERAETLDEAVKSRLPVLSEQVPARIDPRSGREVTREDTPRAGALQAFFDVVGSGPDRTVDRPVLAVMQRHGLAVGPLKRDRTESRDEFRQREIFTGQNMEVALRALTLGEDPNVLIRDQGGFGLPPGRVQAWFDLLAEDPGDDPKLQQAHRELLQEDFSTLVSLLRSNIRRTYKVLVAGNQP